MRLSRDAEKLDMKTEVTSYERHDADVGSNENMFNSFSPITGESPP
jgi:hypothetical protein